MKKFKDYLAESEKTYNYRIKIVGDTPSSMMKDLAEKLKQFDIVRMTDPKTTPVQKSPADFPNFANESVTHVDMECRYPAIEPQIQQLAQLIGMDPNRIRMLTVPYEDGMIKEKDKIETENKDLLTDTDYPAPDKEQKALSKDYATGPYDHEVVKNAYKTNFTVAGGKTPPAVTTNDLPPGKFSPMSTVKRPPKPATGAQPRG